MQIGRFKEIKVIAEELLRSVRSRSPFVSLDAIGANQELVSHGHVILTVFFPDIRGIVRSVIDSCTVFICVIVIPPVIGLDERIRLQFDPLIEFRIDALGDSDAFPSRPGFSQYDR